MHSKTKQWTATLAVALVLTYVSAVAITEVGGFALWSASLAWLGIAAFVCGILLTLSTEGAVQAIIAASMLATLMLTGLAAYIFWRFLGDYFSIFELVISTPFLQQVFPRGILILLTSTPAGLFGVVVARILIVDRYNLC